MQTLMNYLKTQYKDNAEEEIEIAKAKYGKKVAEKALVFDGLFVKSEEPKEDEPYEPLCDFSVEIPDRDNEVLLISGFQLDNYNKNPVLLSGHRYSPEFAIGGTRWIKSMQAEIDGVIHNVLRGKIWFASTPFAQDHKTLIKEGALNAFSHTFLPLEFIEDKKDIAELGFDPEVVGKVFTKVELLEPSIVTIPCNPLSLVASKSVLETKYFKDMANSFEKEVEEIELKKLIASKPEIPSMIESKEEEKPYKGEHACRLIEPDEFDEIKRENDAREIGDKPIDILWGIKEDEPVKEQAYRYKIENGWTEVQAKKHCEDSDGIKFEPALPEEETEELIDNVVGFKELKLANIDYVWNEKLALERVRLLFSDLQGNINFENYKFAFCYYDAKDIENLDAYKLLICDAKNGELILVRQAVINVLSRLKLQEDIIKEDKEVIYEVLALYCESFDLDIPEYKDLGIVFELNQLWELINRVETTLQKQILEIKSLIPKEGEGQSLGEEPDEDGDTPPEERNKFISEEIVRQIKQQLNKFTEEN